MMCALTYIEGSPSPGRIQTVDSIPFLFSRSLSLSPISAIFLLLSLSSPTSPRDECFLFFEASCRHIVMLLARTLL